jgi:hypothetical protein
MPKWSIFIVHGWTCVARAMDGESETCHPPVLSEVEVWQNRHFPHPVGRRGGHGWPRAIDGNLGQSDPGDGAGNNNQHGVA